MTYILEVLWHGEWVEIWRGMDGRRLNAEIEKTGREYRVIAN
jgi:hypothetical protein